MEDALALGEIVLKYYFLEVRLNPCCNGRCTRTQYGMSVQFTLKGLNPCCNGRCTRTSFYVDNYVRFQLVLILVVMEDALAQVMVTSRLCQRMS